MYKRVGPAPRAEEDGPQGCEGACARECACACGSVRADLRDDYDSSINENLTVYRFALVSSIKSDWSVNRLDLSSNRVAGEVWRGD